MIRLDNLQIRRSARGLPLLLAMSVASSACSPGPNVNSFSANVVVQDKAVMKFVRGFAIAVLHTTNKKKVSVACADFPSKYRTVKHGDLRLEANAWVEWSGQEGSPTKTLDVTPGEPFIVAVEGQALHNRVTHVVARGCVERVNASMDAPTSVEIDVRATAGRPCTDGAQCEPTLSHCLVGDGFPAQGYCSVASCDSDARCPPGTKCVQVGSGTICAAVCERPEDCETGNGVNCVRALGPSGCQGACLKPSSPFQACP